jgi:hypothetical protein
MDQARLRIPGIVPCLAQRMESIGTFTSPSVEQQSCAGQLLTKSGFFCIPQICSLVQVPSCHLTLALALHANLRMRTQAIRQSRGPYRMVQDGSVLGLGGPMAPVVADGRLCHLQRPVCHPLQRLHSACNRHKSGLARRVKHMQQGLTDQASHHHFLEPWVVVLA